MQVVNGIHLPDRDKHFAEQIRNNPLYREKGTYQYSKIVNSLEHCRRRNFAIDIGANVGLWTRVLAHKFKRVVAIEPVPENIECLRLNTQGLNNVEIIDCAVSPITGFLSFRLVDDVATAEVVSYDDMNFEVKCVPLDSFGFEGVDFIKVDAEGYEHFIVESGARTIKQYKPIIVVEQKKKRLVKYGLDKYQPTVRLLESWGAKEIWGKAGDHCVEWPDQ